MAEGHGGGLGRRMREVIVRGGVSGISGTLGHLIATSSGARRKKILWSQSCFLAGLWNRTEFCTYTFQRCKILGEGRWRKWFWGQYLRDGLEL